MNRIDGESESFIARREIAGALKQRMRGATDEVMDTMVAVTGPLQAGGPKAAGSATQQDAESGLLVAFSCKDHGADAGELAPTLRSMGHDGSHANAGGQVAVAFQESQAGCREYGTDGTLRADGPGHDPVGTRVRERMAVRRLTPLECERLQGFPDGYTLIERGGKPAADGPRYRALGNSMAVPVILWLLNRIAGAL